MKKICFTQYESWTNLNFVIHFIELLFGLELNQAIPLENLPRVIVRAHLETIIVDPILEVETVPDHLYDAHLKAIKGDLDHPEAIRVARGHPAVGQGRRE